MCLIVLLLLPRSNAWFRNQNRDAVDNFGKQEGKDKDSRK